MKKIGVIVDGDGDLASLNAKFSQQIKVLKTDGPRGHCAQCDKIILSARKQISMLKALKCNKIILMLDLESRNKTAEEFHEELAHNASLLFADLDLNFAIADKMIENWYLADIAFLSKKKVFLKDNLKQKNYEGLHGKNELKSCFKKNYSYSETLHGPQLFVLLRDDIATKNSPSFKKFVSLIDGACE